MAIYIYMAMLVITRWYGVSSEVPPPLALEQVRGISPLCGAINVPLLERINMKTGAKRLIRWSFCRQIVQESLASNFHQKKNRIGSIGIDLSTKKKDMFADFQSLHHFVSSHLPLFPGAPSVLHAVQRHHRVRRAGVKALLGFSTPLGGKVVLVYVWFFISVIFILYIYIYP